MITQQIKPDNGNREGKWVALSIAAILTVGTVLLPYNQTHHSEAVIESYQVPYAELLKEDLAMLAELKLAHEEIRDLQIDLGSYPEISLLSEYWIAPFVQDPSWKRKGEHQWQHLGRGVYLGVRMLEQGASHTLLDTRSEQVNIWIHDESPSPQQVHSEHWIDSEHRQESGWRQVVPDVETQPQHGH